MYKLIIKFKDAEKEPIIAPYYTKEDATLGATYFIKRYGFLGYRADGSFASPDGSIVLTSEAPVVYPLKHYRISLGYTQKELAYLLGVKPSTVCHWERGRTAIPPTALLALATLTPHKGGEVLPKSDSWGPMIKRPELCGRRGPQEIQGIHPLLQ